MTLLRQGVLHHIERDKLDVSGVAPRRVYLGDHPTAGAGHYVFVTDRSEATAWLASDGLGGYVLDDDSANDDLAPFLVSTSPNSILLVAL